ncbi:MAG: DUF4349 domain-containing protein [Bacteroidales bacterium]|jgi:hypothetical protein
MPTSQFIISKTILLAILLSACGPSAKEHEEKRIADSTRVADSLAGVQKSMNDLNLATKTPAEKKFIKTAETKFLVGNVRKASEKIEDLAAKYSGYLIYSHLQNRESDQSRMELSRDSVLISKQIIVENQIELRIPNESLDSLVRELNKLILFLDYRIVKMDEITFNLLANQKASERLKNYDVRQKRHIDTKASKLKETTNAEENVLNRQNQADQLEVENLALADQVKYCRLTIFIYQKPIYYKEIQVLPNPDSNRPNLFARILNALVDGWIIFEYFIIFLFRIWWLFVLFAAGFVAFKFWRKPRRK